MPNAPRNDDVGSKDLETDASPSKPASAPEESNDGGDAQKSPSEGGQGGDDGDDGDDRIPLDLNEFARVFLPGEHAEFVVGVPNGQSIRGAKMVAVPDNGDDVANVLDDIQFKISASSDPRTNWTATIVLDIKSNYYGQKMFVVLEGNFQDVKLEGFALDGFLIVSDTETRNQLHNKLKEDKTLEGGLSTPNSLWVAGYDAAADDTNDGPMNRLGDQDSDKSGSRPLSTSAKAGIGAGAGVAALIVIGLAIFFFLRHRRRRRGAASAKSLPAAGDYAGDKEAHAANVAESPATDEARDSTAFAAGEPPAGRGSTVETPTSGNREVPHSVAHLVEDGMTEEQIRRLEEEERALDHAIEQSERR